MSGYNPSTGIYDLTATKAEYYHRKPIDNTIQTKGMHYFAEVLRRSGLEVVSVHKNFLQVKATQEQIWGALSGKP
jgi:hypothetical protein